MASSCISLTRGRGQARALVFINSLGTDFRIWDEVAAPLARQTRVIRFDKRGPRTFRASAESRRRSPISPSISPAFSTICTWARDDRRPVDRRADRPGALSSAPRSRRFACSLRHRPSDRRRRVLGCAHRAVEAGGVEAIGEAVMQRWFTQDYHRTISRHDGRMAGDADVRTPGEGYIAACGAHSRRRSDRRRQGAFARRRLCVVGDQDVSTPPSWCANSRASFPARSSRSSPAPAISLASKSPMFCAA